MAQATTVIDIVAQVTDKTASGTASATKNVTKLEKSMQNLQKKILGMSGKSKLEIKAELKDMATKGLQAVATKGKQIAGKVWTVTLKAVDLVTAPFRKILNLVRSPITQMITFAGLTIGAADTLNTFKSFEQGMANVKAISGATGKDFEDLTNQARKLGETTQFSASEAAAGMENLAMAGWKTKDILAGMPGLLDLAAAGNVDLYTAADVTSSALAQFRLDASQSTRVADVLAATATNSKTDISGLGESLKMAGTQAGALGYSIEDAALAIGLMGNAGVDASSAGTALRSMLARMSKQEGMTAEESNAMSKAMQKVGVSLTDQNGKSKSLITVLKELRKGFSGMTEVEKASTAANLAGMYAQSGLLAIVNASDESFNKLEAAINSSSGAASEMAKIKMDTLEGSLKYLQSAAEGVKIALGDKLRPYVKGFIDWLTSHMPDIQRVAERAIDFVTGKIDSLRESIHKLTSSPEWAQADGFWAKLELAWDKLIVEPFDAWWNSSGRAWLTEKANSIGEGIGSALNAGLMAILGIDTEGAVTDGLAIGRSFADGFLEGFDGEEVGKALVKAIKGGVSALGSDAATLMPGGKEATGTSGISALLLALGAAKVGSIGYKIFKAGRGVFKGANAVKGVGSAIGAVSGVTGGLEIANAATNGGKAAQSAMAFAEGGALGTGTMITAKAASSGAKGIPVLGAILSALDIGIDAYHGTKNAKEWTGSDTTGAKIASGIGGALGGTGEGIMGDTSALNKAFNIGGGALKGAGVGAVIGSVVPGLGTAAGAAIGAGVGGIGAAVGGKNIANSVHQLGAGLVATSAPGPVGATAAALSNPVIKHVFTKILPQKMGEFRDSAEKFISQAASQATEKVGMPIKEFFGTTLPDKFDEFKSGANRLIKETAPHALEKISSPIKELFTETLPDKFDEFKGGASKLITETAPQAVDRAKEKLGALFTETIPQKWDELKEGISGLLTETASAFFTETLPTTFITIWNGLTEAITTIAETALETIGSTIETVGSAVSTFFGTTVPGFFTQLFNGVVGFFSNAIPAAVANIGASISTFFSNVVAKVKSFFESLLLKVSGSFTSGYAAAGIPHAEGGIMTSPHVGLVAEDGAEAIIPLSPKRRSRGIALWKRAGDIMGLEQLIPHAEGGIFGNQGVNQNEPEDPDESPTSPTPQTVTTGAPQVTISNLTFSVNINGDAQNSEAIVGALKDNIKGLTDEIAYQLATALQQVYSNAPRTAWE